MVVFFIDTTHSPLSSNEISPGAIAAIVCGSILFVNVIVFIICKWCKRANKVGAIHHGESQKNQSSSCQTQDNSGASPIRLHRKRREQMQINNFTQKQTEVTDVYADNNLDSGSPRPMSNEKVENLTDESQSSPEADVHPYCEYKTRNVVEQKPPKGITRSSTTNALSIPGLKSTKPMLPPLPPVRGDATSNKGPFPRTHKYSLPPILTSPS